MSVPTRPNCSCIATSDGSHADSRSGRAFRFMGVALTGLLLAGCQSLYFFPSEEHYWDPADAGLEYEDRWFAADDGVELHGWFLPAQTEDVRGTVLFFHGNAQNVSTHVGSVWWLPRHGFHVFLFDYRGYGKSQGRPSFEGVHRDAEAAFQAVTEESTVDPERLVVFGQSLGGAIALTSSAERDADPPLAGVAVEAPFDSYRQIARETAHGFWLTWPFQYPISWLISDTYAPRDRVDRIAPVPLLLISGDRDTQIRPIHTERLKARAQPPVHRWVIEGAGHNQAMANPEVRYRLLETFRGWVEGDVDAAEVAPEGPWRVDPPRP